MKTKKKLNLLVIIVAAFILLVIGAVIYYNNQLGAISNESNKVMFEIKSGTTNDKILSDLKQQDLIKNDFVTKIYLKLGGNANFKAGVYEVDQALSTSEIVAYLSDAANTIKDDVMITFIEGDWLKDMALKFESNTNLKASELLEYWNNEEVVRSLMETYPFISEEVFNDDIRFLLEGYLFPDTYSFHRQTSNEEVTKVMLDQTLDLYNEYADVLTNSDLSIHELFTLASIVQYEARTVEDMKLIAGVLYNRLSINMPLQVSASVCYAIDLETGDDWRKCETNPDFDSPYNTYKYNGLPPGAIMSFGSDAFDAVINPTDSDYFYFVADVYGDGSVHYAATYEEHLANVERFGL